MSRMTSFIKRITVLGCALCLFACSSGNDSASGLLVTDSKGKHPADWLGSHFLAHRASLAAGGASSCTECHGSDLKGGISKVSCFSAQLPNGMQCHATRFGHPDNWANPTMHGRAGAMAAPGISTGFAYCAKCHGSDLKGDSAVSCYSCHDKAPHPAKPWIGSGLSHGTTASGNAAVCNQCHAAGNNFGTVLVSAANPASPAPPAPDCYNNTMCHGGNVNPPHAKSVAYLQGAQHGLDAAGKNPARPELGLASCRSCHAQGNRFNLGTNNMVSGCETCHAQQTAHPTPWLPARTGSDSQRPTPGGTPNTTSHATVPAAQFGTSCTPCHGAALDGVGGSAPSCMSGTPKFGISCHATSVVAQPTGCVSCHLAAPASGAHAKHLALPGVTCDACHTGGGVDSITKDGRALHANGAVNVASANYWARTGTMALNDDKTCSNARCHGGGVAGKTPAWGTGTLNVAECLKCHQQGDAGSTPQTPQFNSFYSGLYSQVTPAVNLHQSHLGRGAGCTDCHTMTAANHFSGLATPTFEAPGNTVASSRMGAYDKNLARCSNVSCHSFVPATANWR